MRVAAKQTWIVVAGLAVAGCYSPNDPKAPGGQAESGSRSDSGEDSSTGEAPTSAGPTGSPTTGSGESGDESGGSTGESTGTTTGADPGCRPAGTLQIHGEESGDFAGWSVAAAGDVNGDGLDDVLIGAPYASSSGRAYVVFGTETTEDIRLNTLEGDNAGVVLEGEAEGDAAGYAVVGVGDYDGDGNNDLAVAARFGGSGHGRVYIVGGGGPSGEVAAVGRALIAPADFGEAGYSLAAGGDVDGDGSDDLLIGAPQGGPQDAGRVYAVTDLAHAVFLNELVDGGHGFVIEGATATEQAGASVAVVPDLDGDSFDEVLVGSPWDNDGAGKASLVFGRPVGTPTELSAVELGFGGFTVRGAADQFGSTVSPAGDANADGTDDFIVGAPETSEVYVIQSPTAPAVPASIDDLVLVGAARRFYSADPYARVGSALHGADGMLLVGARGSSGPVQGAGRVYALAPSLGAGAVLIESQAQIVAEGSEEFADLGRSAAVAGDFDGDGCLDAIVGAPTADANAAPDAGIALIVFNVDGV